MRVRLFAAALMLALLGLALVPGPVLAQTDPEECGNFAPLCEGLQEVGNGIAPITDGLDAVTDPAAEQLKPALVAIEDLVGQLRDILGQATEQFPCEQLAPVIDALQPLLNDAQGILDVASDELIEAAEGLGPILREANALVDDVLDVCVAAEAGGHTDPGRVGVIDTDTAVPEVGAEDDPRLPETGGGAALLGLAVMGVAGTVLYRTRRR